MSDVNLVHILDQLGSFFVSQPTVPENELIDELRFANSFSESLSMDIVDENPFHVDIADIILPVYHA